MTTELATLARRIDSLKAQRDAALIAGQTRHAEVCGLEIEKARLCVAALEAERYERFGYDARG